AGDVVAVSVTVNSQTATGPDFTVTDGGGGGEAPAIDAIDPTEGPTGTAVTITGTNFSATAGDNTVEFGSATATVTSASTTELVAEVPSELSAGDVVAVSVTVNSQTATGPDFTVTDGGGGGEAPAIDAIDPTEGEVGTAVTITGSNFGATASDNAVAFGGVEASINSASETEVVAVVPNSLGAGAVDVTLTANGQTATSPQQFTVTVPAPVIDAINPTEGEVGTVVTITGSNFGATAGDNAVAFGGVEASINSASETEVVAVVPNSLGAGAVDVTLTANGQTATAPQQFTVTVPAPVIDAINPTSGIVGTEVTITGENFSSTIAENTVTFGGTEATVNSASETELVAVVPSSLSPGSYTVEVTVNSQTATGPDFTVLEEGTPQFPITGSNASIDYGGCSLCGITNPTNVIDGNTDNYATVNLPLSISSSYWVSVESAGNIPAGGSAGFVVSNEGGLIGLDLLEGITLTTYLDGAVQETISDAALLNLEVVSGTTDRQFISFQTSSEFDEIRIEFGSLLGADSDYFVFAAYGGMEAEPVPGPAISSVSPERGPEGTEVTITGDNFGATAGDNTVTFDGTTVTNILSASETELVVEVPTGATTGPVAVTTSGGTATSTDDFVVGAVPLTGSGLSATGDTQGVCLGCDVTNTSNVIDSDGDNFASIDISLGVGGSGYVAVENTAEVMSGGGQAGFVIALSGGTLDLSLIESVTVETYLDGTLQESESGSALLLLDLLSGTSTDRQFIGFETTTDFDQVVISLGALVGADATYEVYGVYDDYFVTE
ncbi:IPT/TIG domain-containing protein, partial [Fodinibius salsisoli]